MQKPKRLSQADVAKSLGLSRNTVSLVLRGAEGVAEATRKKVLAASSSLGYRPNSLVRSLRSGKSRTIGILAQPHDSYWRDVCYGLHDRLIEAEHLPLFLYTNDHLVSGIADYSLKQIHNLLDHWVDAVILWPHFANVFAQHLHEFKTRNIPLVTIDYLLPNDEADMVGQDESQIASLLVDHLAPLGHRQVLVMSGPNYKESSWASERSAAILAAWAKIPGGRADKIFTREGPQALQENAEIALAALRDHSEVTAVFACSDTIARSVYRAAKKLGWNIPSRLSVISVADLDVAAEMSPPLTTVRHNGYAVGQRAAQIGLERSSGLLMGASRQFREPGKLIVRESTGPVATSA